MKELQEFMYQKSEELNKSKPFAGRISVLEPEIKVICTIIKLNLFLYSMNSFETLCNLFGNFFHVRNQSFLSVIIAYPKV